MKRLREPILKAEAIFLLVAGLLMGTVFVIGMSYWESPVKRSEAICTEAAFLSYEEIYGRWANIKEVIVRFSDLDQQSIDGVCVNDELLNQLENIESGAVLQLLLNPNSYEILEIVEDGEIVMDFDDTQNKLRGEVKGFTVLGLICYAVSIFAAVKLIRKEII